MAEAQALVEPIASESDLFSVSSDNDETLVPRLSTPRRIGFVVLGVTCLLACGVFAFFASSGSEATTNRISIRELFEGEDMMKVTTDNTMHLMKLRPEKRGKVRAAMTSGLAKMREDARYQKLSQVSITPRQKDDVLNMLAHISDPRVQQVGFEVAKAITQGDGREMSKQRLTQLFNAERVPELRQLREEVFHSVRKGAMQDAHFNPNRMRIIKSMRDSSDSKAAKNRALQDSIRRRRDPNTGSTGLGNNAGSIIDGDDVDEDGNTALDVLGFFGAFEEQARIVLDNLDEILPGFGKDDNIPSEAKSFVGFLDFLTETTDCVGRAEGNDMKEGMCPLKYASAAFDAISCLDNELQLNNQNLGLDLDTLASFFGDAGPPTTTKAASPGWGFP